MSITERDIDKILGVDVDEATELLITQFGATEYEDKIDDGGDEEDTYIMRRSVELLDGQCVRLYYLDVLGIVEEATLN